jgi:hypothetical protein
VKLILRQYLASLRERDELDAIVPDLLSQLGLNVFSRPRRGTRQDGVDVAAVGRLDGGPERVYLFSIKPGNLTRSEWDGQSAQALRPSLNEILDSFLPNRLPVEHRGLPVAVVICLGGDVHEQVRPQLTGFARGVQERHPNVSIEEWNGDELAARIQSCFLRDELLPNHARPRLRKALALIDEPEESFHHFAVLLASLAAAGKSSQRNTVMALRQISLCLWTLFAWARDAANLESAYRSSELSLLLGWKLITASSDSEGTIGDAEESAFESILMAYQRVCHEFLDLNVLPHVGVRDGLSVAVNASCGVDVNLKLFDLLGRVALEGIWSQWQSARPDADRAAVETASKRAKAMSGAVISMIAANPTLLSPLKDDDTIEVALAGLLLLQDESKHDQLRLWLRSMISRAMFAYRSHGPYPCILRSYDDLLGHPVRSDDYRASVTSGSVLYPTISLVAAILGDDELYSAVSRFKVDDLAHCNFQLWFPDQESESAIYDNRGLHGSVLSDAPVERPPKEFVHCVASECNRSLHFNKLSAVHFECWPLVLLACRHHRLPLPPQVFPLTGVVAASPDIE